MVKKKRVERCKRTNSFVAGDLGVVAGWGLLFSNPRALTFILQISSEVTRALCNRRNSCSGRLRQEPMGAIGHSDRSSRNDHERESATLSTTTTILGRKIVEMF